jgi:hypothetical protein
MSLLRYAAREPVVHFALLGALIFVVAAAVGERTAGTSPDRIAVTDGRVADLAAAFARTWQRSPTPAELDGLVADWVRDEIFTREARALGLDRDDKVVHRRLREKMEFLIEDAVAGAPPTEEELAAFLAAHAARFRREPRLSFRQVYVNRDRRGTAAAGHARTLRIRLATADPAADLAAAGDRLMVPPDVEAMPASEVARLFGAGFATALAELEPGRWSAPIESGYGLHVVLLRDRTPGALPALTEIRPAVERELLAARRAQMVEAAYRALRARYDVVVEHPGGATVPAR